MSNNAIICTCFKEINNPAIHLAIMQLCTIIFRRIVLAIVLYCNGEKKEIKYIDQGETMCFINCVSYIKMHNTRTKKKKKKMQITWHRTAVLLALLFCK